MSEQHALSIFTVGGSPEPVIHSLLAEPRPDRVIFVCSSSTRHLITAPQTQSQCYERSCPVCGGVPALFT